MADDVQDLLTAEETAARLGIAKQTLAAWRCHGRGPAFLKISKTPWYARTDVEAWIAAQRVDPAAKRAGAGR